MTRCHACPTALLAAGALCTALVGAAGCTPAAAPEAKPAPSEQPAGDASEDAVVNTALVVVLGDGSVLFVDTDSESPYYPTNLEDAEILDIDGNAISAEDLASGNVVRVTGNGIMLQSYPGQYPGISKVEVTSVGSPADAEKYAELADQLWDPRDPSQPPAATLEYRTELAAAAVMLDACSYTWSFEQEGQTQTVTADAAHPTQLEADGLPDARVDGPTEVTINFDVPATAAGIVRWREDELEVAAQKAGSAAALELGSVAEDIMAASERQIVDGDVRLTVEPGWRYAIEAYFDGGEAVYVFTVR